MFRVGRVWNWVLRKRVHHCPSLRVSGGCLVGYYGCLVFWPSASRSPTSHHFAKILLLLVTLPVESCVAGHTPHDNPLGALPPQAEAYSGCMHCSGKPSNRTKLPDTMSNRRHFPTPGLPNPVATRCRFIRAMDSSQSSGMTRKLWTLPIGCVIPGWGDSLRLSAPKRDGALE